MSLKLALSECAAGETLPLKWPGVNAPGHTLLSGAMPAAAGTRLLAGGGEALFTVTGSVWLPGRDEVACRCALLSACAAIGPEPEIALSSLKTGYAVAIITLSDKGAAGQREDTAGPAAQAMLEQTLPTALARRFVIPDSSALLRALLATLALEQGYDLICTCGGTGLGPRDITPQTTRAALDQELPGFAEAMRAASLAKTPNAIISRAVCGTIGQCLALNLPGSRRAAEENLAALLPALEHSLAKLKGDSADCGG
ncbi:MAG: MogA/MoaB family molybdenum cofactor biosynthesis protein [Desulfovibrio sp.]|nr:MogA/MoaB family molybdenum cofactor biosynthesis protein [Desulfovibrio sp.]